MTVHKMLLLINNRALAHPSHLASQANQLNHLNVNGPRTDPTQTDPSDLSAAAAPKAVWDGSKGAPASARAALLPFCLTN